MSLLPFLNTFLKLESYLHFRANWILHPQITEELSRQGIHLKKLQTCMLPDLSDDAMIAEHIRLSEHWTTIDLHHSFYFGSLTTAALLDHCGQLESLDLSGSKLSSSQNQSILARATRLKTVLGLCISAEDLIALRWGSLALEEFSCKIIVPRPDVGENKARAASSVHLDAIAKSWSVQRQVYRKLAEQTVLKGFATLSCKLIPRLRST